jgi:hypothetical protein
MTRAVLAALMVLGTVATNFGSTPVASAAVGPAFTCSTATAFMSENTPSFNSNTDWENSGDALIALHGPLGSDSQIGTTGAPVSHGCIRLHESDLEQLRPVPVGSPIDIVPA